MNYRPISQEPKIKSKVLLLICLNNDGSISCCSDVFTWEDAQNFRKEKFNGWSAFQYSHWAYLNPPKQVG
jgi:hypothetical protein